MKKIFKKTTCLFLTTIAFLSAGCNKGNPVQEQNTVQLSDLDIWGCVATEKVLRDYSVENYADIKEEPDVSILMAKGEYESDQIIITPKVDVPYYNVTVSDLTLVGGEDKIKKEQISVYKEKYIEVGVVYQSGNGFPEGFYPDALLPLEAAVNYEENNIKAGENQGIYITVETSLGQTAGTYTGSLTIDFKDCTKTVPVSVQVVDVTVSEENHARSAFLTGWNYAHGELNSTQEMRDAYTEALIKYRLAPTVIVNENNHTDEDIKKYVEKSYSYMINPKCSNIGMPYYSTSVLYEPTQTSYSAIDPVIFEKYLWAYAEKSFETGFNMLKKCTLYNSIIDEPLGRIPEDQVKLNCYVFNTTITKVANAIEADETITSSIKEEVVASIRVLPHIVTCDYYGEFADYDSEEYVNTFCPVIRDCDSALQRAQYDRQNERWWYVANQPKYPFPNVMIDNTNVLNTRAIGWMQGEYDFQGFLYWAVNAYNLYEIGTGNNICLEEYYETRANRTGHGSHGEGFMFYPGGQYGLDEPVGSLRLEAMRDGLEEYELILALKEKYQELGFSADALITSLNSVIYLGTRVSTDSTKFMSARKSLLELCAAASSSAEMCITESTDNGDGTVTNKVYIKDGYTLKSNGVVLTGGTAYGEGKIYTVESKLENETNYLTLSFTADSIEYTYEQNLGGKVVDMDATSFYQGFSSDLATVTTSLVDGSTIGLDEQFAKVEVAATSGKSQRFKFETETVSSLDEKAKKLVFVFYNDSNEDVKLTLYAKYKKEAMLSELSTITLKAKSFTTFEVDVGTISWTRTGGIKHLLMKLGENQQEQARTIYLRNITVYYK